MKTMNKILGIGLIVLIAMVGIGAVSAEPVERTILGNAWIYDIGVTDDFDYFIYDGTSDTAFAIVGINHDSDHEWLYESSFDANLNDIPGLEAIGAWNYTPAPIPVIPDYEIRANGIGYSDNGVEYRDVIKSTSGGITVDDWVVPEHEPNYDIHVYDSGVENTKFSQNFGLYPGDGGLALEIPGNRVNLVGSTFTGNYADNDGGAIYYTNSMNGGLHDGNLYFYTEPYYTNGMTGSLSDGNGNLLTVDQSGFVVPDSTLNPPRPDINKPYYPTEVTEIVINDFSAEMTGDL